MKTRLAATLALFALVVAACGGAVTTTAISNSFESVQFTGTKGRVIITGTDNAPSVQADSSSDVNVTSEVRDGVLVVEHDCADCAVDYEIEVPTDVDVSITNQDGTISVANFEGNVDITGGSGNITLRNLSGVFTVTADQGNILGLRLTASQASLSVGTGNVDVSFDEMAGVVDIEVTDGDITIQAPGGPYDVDASTADGGVDNQLAVDAGSSSTMTLRTGKGDITLYDD